MSSKNLYETLSAFPLCSIGNIVRPLKLMPNTARYLGAVGGHTAVYPKRVCRNDDVFDMMMSVAGVMVWLGMRAGAPSPEDVADALQQYAISGLAPDCLPASPATQMLLADLAAHFNCIRILGAKEQQGSWRVDTLVQVQTPRMSPVDLKIQFNLMQRKGDWSITAAQLLQA
jgi:hypothetical protein